MSTDVQGMLVRIEATTQQLRQELARAESAVGKTSQRIDGDLGRIDAAFDRLEESAAQAGSVVDSALTGIAAATVASVAGLGALIATTAAAGKELGSLSFLANASTAEFQRMAAGARSVGVDQGKLADVLKDVNDRVGEFASTGGGEMKDFFEQIAPKVGVTVQQFQKLSGPQALQLYYDSLEKAGLNQQEMTFYMEAMADEATALIPLLVNGGKGFQEMGDRAERLGVVLSDLELSQLAELSKIAGEAGMAWEGVTNQLVAGLQPAISALVESLDGEGFSAAAQDMGDGIRFVIDNLDALVITVGSLGAGRLAIRFVEGVQAISGYVQSVRQATEAERIHTQAVQASALEQVRRAEGELNAARIQAISTRGTVEHTAALSRQRQAKLDLAVANQAYTAAQTAANAVTGTATTLLRGALGLFGGPVGLVTMIGTAAAGWLLFADNSDKARQATLDLTQPVEALRREIEALTLAQANSRLLQLEEGQKALRGELEDTTEALAAQVVQYDYWGNRFTVGQREASAAWAEFMAAVNRGDDIGQAAIALADATGASAEMRAEIISTAAEMETQRGQIDQNAAAQAMLEGHMRSLTDATRENTAVTGENTGSKGGNTDAAQKYLEQLQKQLNAMRDKTALQAAERFLTENSITAESELGQQILATATAKDRQREADTAATAARKSSTKAVKDEAKELQSLLDKLLPAEAAQREQVETIETLDEAWQKGRITLEQYSEAMSAAWAAQSKAEWDKANKAQEELNKTLKASNDAFEQLEDQLDPVRAASKRLAEQQKILRAEYDRGEISLERYNALLGRAQVEYDGVAKEASAWVKLTADAFERVNAAGADMWYEFFDTGRVTFDSLLGIGKRWAAEMANALTMRGLTAVFGGMLGMGGSSSALAADGVGAAAGGGFGLNEAWSAISGAYRLGTSGFGQAVLGGWNAGQGLLGGLQGAASAGWSYGTGALGSLGSGLGSMFGGGVQGGAGVMLDAAGNLVNYGAGGVLGSGLTAGALGISGIGGALYGYQQAGWKGAATGGLGAAGGALLGNMLLPGIGGIVGGMLGGMLGGSVFGGDWQQKGMGIAVAGREGDFWGRNYKYFEKEGGLFGSDKSKYEYSSLDATLEKQLGKRFDDVKKSAAEIFEGLGFSVEQGALDGLTVARRHISTGSKAAQQKVEERLAQWFTKVGDAGAASIGSGLIAEMASKIQGAAEDEIKAIAAGYGLGDVDVSGLVGLEGKVLTRELERLTGFGKNAYAALSQLVGKLDTVNTTFEMLNLSLFEGSLAGAKMAEDMVALAGGMEAFTAATTTYYDKFFSATEKTEDAIEAVVRQFAEMDLVLPASREQYRVLVESIDVSTAAGRELVSTLMQLAGAADAAYSAFDAMRAEGEASVNAARQNAIAAYQREASALQTTINKFGAFAASLAGFRDQLSLTILGVDAGGAQLETLRRQFDLTASKAKLGDEQALGALPGLGANLANAALSFSSTREDYVAELARISQASADAEATAGRQASIAEQQLDAMTAQLEALGLINDSVQSLTDALVALQAAEAAADTAQLDFIAGMVARGFEALRPAEVVSALGLGFDVLDANTDKLLNQDELRAALKDRASDEQLRALGYVVDSNFDGLISATELTAAAGMSQAQAITAGLAGVQNAIGSAISLAQAQAGIGGIAGAGDISNQFGQLDTNKDGLLGADEIAGTAPAPVKPVVEMSKQQLLDAAKAAGIKTSGYQTLAGTIRIAEALAEKTGTAITTNSSKTGKGKTVQAGFAYGGYTGPGGRFDPAGIVHAGEVVWSQDDLKRWGGWQTVDALRKGQLPELSMPELRLFVPRVAAQAMPDVGMQAELRALRVDVANVRSALLAIASHTEKTAHGVGLINDMGVIVQEVA